MPAGQNSCRLRATGEALVLWFLLCSSLRVLAVVTWPCQHRSWPIPGEHDSSIVFRSRLEEPPHLIVSDAQEGHSLAIVEVPEFAMVHSQF